MPRAVDEWIGKTDDTPVPTRVRLRVFDHWNGRDHITGRKIEAGDAWQVDHIKPMIQGGENRETNLAPILTDKHREKTADEVREKSIVARKKAKHLGLTKARNPMPGSKASRFRKRMDGTVERREP